MNLRSITGPREQSQVGYDLAQGERRVKLKNNSGGIAFVVVFKGDRHECNAFGKTVSQQDTGKLLDLRARLMDFHMTPIYRSTCAFPIGDIKMICWKRPHV